MALVKWSISEFINHLSPSTLHHRVVQGLRATVVVWAVASTVTSLFQCPPPQTWNYISNEKSCADRRGWWAFVSIYNVVTEFIIVTLYFLVIYSLQISLVKRANVLAIFSSRLM